MIYSRSGEDLGQRRLVFGQVWGWAALVCEALLNEGTQQFQTHILLVSHTLKGGSETAPPTIPAGIPGLRLSEPFGVGAHL